MKYSVNKNICVVTSTRAEYGLLKPLLKKIKNEPNFELQLVVTGMHLSPEFGYTCSEIEKDGFFIDDKIEILLSSDTGAGIAKSMGLTMISFADSFSKLNPDIIILLGDRYEIFSVASVATVLKIPIAHISGGDLTEGAFDDVFRHSISKMSFLHFTTTEEYKNRVIQLGEEPWRVFNVGNLGVENALNVNFIEREKLFNQLGLKVQDKIITVIFHTTTLYNVPPDVQLNELLKAVSKLNEFKFVFIKGNSDTGGRKLNQYLEEFTKQNNKKYKLFASLNVRTYLSLLKESIAIIGNSSSGIVEAPSFKIGTINIGDRQKGRIMSGSVINCKPNEKNILQSFNKLLSDDFQRKLVNIKNPYGDGQTSDKIIKILKEFLFNKKISLKKKFYDIEVDLT